MFQDLFHLAQQVSDWSIKLYTIKTETGETYYSRNTIKIVILDPDNFKLNSTYFINSVFLFQPNLKGKKDWLYLYIRKNNTQKKLQQKFAE